MRSQSLCTILATLFGLALAAPLEKRQSINDGMILNYALTLEYLEANFYKEALANYSEADFEAAGFPCVRQNIVQIGAHEQSHATFLSSPPPPNRLLVENSLISGRCPYCCWDYAYSTLYLFLPSNRCNHIPRPCSNHRGVPHLKPNDLMCSVGVSAYLGAAASITNKQYLTAAGSILTIEARHNTYLLGANRGNPVPSAFDTPLDFDEVYSLASAFIVSCPPSNPALPVKAFPALAVIGGTAVKAGQTVNVAGSWTDGIYAVILSGLNSYSVQVENNQFQFPSSASITGQVWLV
jgi:hypothetical protein